MPPRDAIVSCLLADSKRDYWRLYAPYCVLRAALVVIFLGVFAIFLVFISAIVIVTVIVRGVLCS